jgi:hypothetical protein
MTCKKCGAAMIGTTCPPCTVRSLERLNRELGDELGGIVGADGRPFDNYGGHPLAGGGTFSNRLNEEQGWGRYWTTSAEVEAWLRARRGANGKPVIDVDAREVDPHPDAKALTRTR